MTPYWAWTIGFWCGIGVMLSSLLLTTLYLTRKETESRFLFLWGFYKRAASETHVYSSWCWGAFTFVRARLAIEKGPDKVLVTPGGARVNVYNGSSEVTRPATPPEVIARRMDMAARLTKRWAERARGNPSAPALEAQGGWEDDEEDD